MKTKLLALLLACVMALGLAACGGGGNDQNNTSAGNDTPAQSNNTAPDDGAAAPENTAPEDTAPAGDGAAYKVGISQLVTHPALDLATQGFQDALNELLPGQVKFDYQNAANDSATCSTIANAFVSAGVDLIMANATTALQAAVTATADIPVLGTSITEYGVALGIDNFSGTVGGNISGTSDLAPP